MQSTYQIGQDFDDEIKKISESNMDTEQKNKLIIEKINNLPIIDKRFYLDRISSAKRSILFKSEKPKCDKKQAGKFALLEIENMGMEYSLQMAYVSMMHYMVSRYEAMKISGREKKVLRRYIDEVFGYQEKDHLCSINELYYDGHKERDPRNIPDITGTPLDVVKTSFEQMNNFYQYAMMRRNEMAAMTTGFFGNRPSQIANVTVHGVFDEEKDIDTYRIKSAENIDGIVYTIPVGVNSIIEPFQDLTDETIVYHPDNPEYEELSRRSVLQKRITRHGIQNRIKKSNIAKSEDQAKLNKIRNTIEQLNGADTSSLDDNDKNSIEGLKNSLSDLLTKCTNMKNDGKGIVETITNDGKEDMVISPEDVSFIEDNMKQLTGQSLKRE